MGADLLRYVFRIGKEGLGYYLDLGPLAVGDTDGDADGDMLHTGKFARDAASAGRPQSAPPSRSRYPEGSASLPASGPTQRSAVTAATWLPSVLIW